MHHLAILNPKRKLLDKILSGEKTIESRWYVHKIAPWGKITAGDVVYFKDAGKHVTVHATVHKVIQKKLQTPADALPFLKQFAKQIQLSEDALANLEWLHKKRYMILIFLSKPQKTQPFSINKQGYGSACAWISVPDIELLKETRKK
ncbi:MAG: ASCH domain-containing protein [Candidatus Dojkabacteria bacterium]|nr:MAG: ASCH domain-containing protein [Candidatus Dojkabacteria bacterium]